MPSRRRQPALKRADNGSGSTDRHIDLLLALLMDHPMVVLSGAKIAREIGVSRSAVWGWVERLRALGVHVQGRPNAGYRLEKIPDVLAPSLLAERLRSTPYGKRIHHYFRVDSSNERALRLAAKGEPHGALVVAEEQTAGRGRLGRKWHSQKAAGIYVSAILRPPLSPAQAPLLTLAAGLAARTAITEISGLEVDLRWPNDLLLNGKKLCGVLTEMQAEARRIHYVVVGIGVNVNQARFPAYLADVATSLRMGAGSEYSRLEILVRLLTAFDGYYNRLLAIGPQSLIAAFTRASSYARGKRVCVSEPQGEYTGLTAGLDPAGSLLVRREDTGKIAPVLAGDVRPAD